MCVYCYDFYGGCDFPRLCVRIEKFRTRNTQPIILIRMTLDPGAPGGSGWTFGLSSGVSAMLLGVVDACVACMPSCVLFAHRYVSSTRFFSYAAGFWGILMFRYVHLCPKKNLNASRPSEHLFPHRGEKVKTLTWDHRLQKQNLFIAFKRVP